MFVFREHLRLQPLAVLVEVVALAALVSGVVALSRSRIVQGHVHDDEAKLALSP
ncbi:MAG: hypothetical protein M1522_04400 [Actinobacteria bacterium]|nr:hypothetical protein [Actinomycetota bacterium]